jgi:hypothetical protein
MRILVAADGRDDCHVLAASVAARVIEVPGPSGPAAARNRAAAEATGDVLVFVDADVVAAPDALAGMCRLLESAPEIAGVFGAYDVEPPEPNFMSQYKNLSHAQIHETGNPEAGTFWAGLGAIRTSVFRQVSGFDERFRRPSVEDIELASGAPGGIPAAARPRLRGRHLALTLGQRRHGDPGRGIPWTQLIYKFGALTNDLNTRFDCARSCCPPVGCVNCRNCLLPVRVLVGASLVALVALNHRYCHWFARHRGWLFALKVIPAHVLHHLSNGVSFVAGTMLYLGTRLGLRLPGALPLADWPS